jgi:hypothetical protein
MIFDADVDLFDWIERAALLGSEASRASLGREER